MPHGMGKVRLSSASCLTVTDQQGTLGTVLASSSHRLVHRGAFVNGW